MFHRMLEYLIRLFLQQFISRFTDETYYFQCIFVTVIVIIQFICPERLVIPHQRAAWFDDQLASAQRRVRLRIRQMDEHFVHTPLGWLRLELPHLMRDVPEGLGQHLKAAAVELDFFFAFLFFHFIPWWSSAKRI